eukprot:gene10378-2907_t
MKNKNIEPNEVILSTIIKCYLTNNITETEKRRGIKKSIKILKDNLRKGMKIPPFNLLIFEYLKKNDLKKIKRLFSVLKKNEIKFNERTIENLIYHFSNEGKIHLAMKYLDILKKFPAKNGKLNENDFGILISNLDKNKRNFEKNKNRIFKKMKKEKIKLTEDSFTRCLKSFLNSNLNDANFTKNLLIEMKNENLKLNQNLVLILVKQFLNSNKMNQLSNFISNLKDQNLLKNEKIYNEILQNHMKNERFQKIETFWNLMLTEKDQINLQSFSLMMRYYNSIHQYQKSIDLIEKMKSFNISPDLVIYRLSIFSHLKKKDIHSAFNIIEIIQQNGMYPNESVFTTLLKGSFLLGNLEMVDVCLKEINKYGFQDSEKIKMIMKSYQKIESV